MYADAFNWQFNHGTDLKGRFSFLPLFSKVEPDVFVDFDETGYVIGKVTKNVVREITNGNYTDVHIFSHGWNTTAKEARELYKDWIANYCKLLEEHPLPDDYKPFLLGVTWPSIILDSDSEEEEKATLTDIDMKRRIEDLIPSGDPIREEFEKLCRMDLTTEVHVAEESSRIYRLFELVSPLYSFGEDAMDGLGAEQPTYKEVAEAFISTFDNRPQVLGLPASPLLIKLFRILSFWTMRDRAALVGRNGVHDLLTEILTKTNCRVHLSGHSFGAEVMLSAVAKKTEGTWPYRKICTMLLLQPAVISKGFVEGKLGVYRQALDRVKMPVVSTFSKNDKALRLWFPLALMIRSGKINKAVEGLNDPGEGQPSKYSALGGHPPFNITGGLNIEGASAIGDYYAFPPCGLCAIRMHNEISNHSDIDNQATNWLMRSLMCGSFS